MSAVAQPRRRLSPAVGSLLLLAVAGAGLIAFRFYAGLGAVTNLSDGYPWGFWIAIDILVGIALAAGGFVLAGIVEIFGRREFQRLVRPAILTALLGYLFFVLALLVDLGRPWNLWTTVISWNHASPMFEVAWCVMFYTFVLVLEFVPIVLDRFRLESVRRSWYGLVPFLVVAMLTLFCYAMTGSAVWAAITLALMLGWEVLMRAGVMPRDKQIPLLLIMAGIMLSTLHQSSLGTLFLISDKVLQPWHSTLLPLLFFLSAVMVAPASVIVESLTSARAFGLGRETTLLFRLSRVMPILIGAYLVARVVDAIYAGVAPETFELSVQGAWWWIEILLLVAALSIFATPEITHSARGLMTGALLTIAGLVVNRTGVALVGIVVPEYPRYVPRWSEVMITIGIVSLAVLVYRFIVRSLPVIGEVPIALHEPEEREQPRMAAAAGTALDS